MNHRIFERTLRSLVFRGARLFECREILKLDGFIVHFSLDLDFAVSLRLVLNVLAESWYEIGSTQRDNYLTAEDIFRDGQTCPRVASNLV